MNILILLIQFWGASSGRVQELHPIHISVCEVNYSTREKSVQVSVKLFIDDFGTEINKLAKKDLKLCTPKEIADVDRYISQYINQNLHLDIDGKRYTLSMIGKEVEPKELLAVWCYLEAIPTQSPKAIKIENKLMLSLFDDQRNITYVKKDNRPIDNFMFDADYTVDAVEW
jgi:hypothetical protein